MDGEDAVVHGERVPIARARRKAFLDALNDYINGRGEDMPLNIPYYEMDIPRLVTAAADWLACLFVSAVSAAALRRCKAGGALYRGVRRAGGLSGCNRRL